MEARLQNERKSLVLAYVFWLCIGYLGAHLWYLGRRRHALVYVVCVMLMTASVLLTGAVNAFGFDTGFVERFLSGVPILIVSFGMIADLFLMPRYARQALEAKRRELIERYQQQGYL
ncbi:membrane protein containing TM2 domain protein [gut metagenome]|uniref:Membrane protein containing TM2 domain protein n=1 Tax=gut metagenome TaxID=749906 RepID=J9G4W0_9ZZZZ